MTYVCVCEHWEYYKEGQQAGRINKEIKKRSKPYSQKQAKLLHIAHKSHL